MVNLSYGGLKDGGTWEVDTVTATAIGKDYASAVNKVVTIKGNKVGYGAKGSFIFGVISKVEPYENGSETLVATVNYNNTFEDVMLTSTVADQPTDNVPIVCNGSGGVAKPADATPIVTGIYLETDTTTTIKTCKIRLY